MRQRLTASAKSALVGLGSRLPAQAVNGLRIATGYVAVGRWVVDNGYGEAPRVIGRKGVFDAMIREVGNNPIAYLEFGVFEGASLKYWLNGVRNPQAEFHGFDSFEGLPETFDSTYGAGHFAKGGVAPKLDDDRVEFHIGWFEETLPRFEVPTGKRLVLTLDADLYSATKLVLVTLNDHITPGTLIYFDELSRIEHEPAAFDDYRRVTGKRFRALALEQSLNTGAFICY